MSSEQGPISKLLSIAWSVFFACFLIWLGITLIQHIWVWLLVIVVVAILTLVAVWWWRFFRS